MRYFIKTILFFLVILQFSWHKENLDVSTSNPYGGINGRLVLYFESSKNLPATITVESKTYNSIQTYYPNGVDCDDTKVPFFILPEGYHNFTANFLYQGRSVSGKLYIKKGECRTYHLDVD